MSIINRDVSRSSQREAFPAYQGPTATGATFVLASIPYPCAIDQCVYSAFGLSGSPTIQLIVNRVVAGAGSTAFNLGSTTAMQAFGTSGSQGLSLPAMGSTVATLAAGDVLMVQLGGTTSAVTGIAVTAVLRPIADIIQYFGVQL